MPWDTSLNPDQPIIEITYTGFVSAGDLFDCFQNTLNLVRSSGRTLLLADCSTFKGGHSLLDLYSLANTLLTIEDSHLLREAVILPGLPGPAEMAGFWDNVCNNRGITVRIFENRQEALEWLLAKPAA